MNFVERAGELLAVATAPLAAADEAHQLALGERTRHSGLDGRSRMLF